MKDKALPGKQTSEPGMKAFHARLSSHRFPPATSHAVTLNWNASRESGVNSLGGGYQVAISGQPTISVPYTSGATAPTTTKTSLLTGVYTVTVRAYAALDVTGGNAGSVSPGQSITVTVP